MILIFLGLPGSGKGTQAQELSRKYAFEQLSTGDLVRKEIAAETDIGLQIKSKVEAGEYPSDEIILELVKKKLDFQKNYILDGFPRTSKQVMALDQMLEKQGRRIDCVIKFDIDEQTVIKRLSGRFSCAKCGHIYNRYFAPTQIEGVCDICHTTNFLYRADDSEESVTKRLQVYKDITQIIENYYLEKKVLKTVDANQPALTVLNQLETVLKEQGVVLKEEGGAQRA